MGPLLKPPRLRNCASTVQWSPLIPVIGECACAQLGRLHPMWHAASQQMGFPSLVLGACFTLSDASFGLNFLPAG